MGGNLREDEIKGILNNLLNDEDNTDSDLGNVSDSESNFTLPEDISESEIDAINEPDASSNEEIVKDDFEGIQIEEDQASSNCCRNVTNIKDKNGFRWSKMSGSKICHIDDYG